MAKLWLFIPILVALIGVAMRFGMAHGTRFRVLSPAPPALDSAQLSTLTKGSSSLCVGCTSGLGAGLAKVICEHGGDVVVVGRRRPEALLAACPTRLEWVQADFSSMQTAQAAGRKLGTRKFNNVIFTLDFISGDTKMLSKEGIEMNTAVYFLSRFVMIDELLSAGLGASPSRKPRVFSMAFPGVPDVPQFEDLNWDSTPWASWKAHKNAVVAQDAVVLGLSKRHPDVNFFGLNPGIIKTDILASFLGGPSSVLFALQQLVIGAIGRSVEDYSLNTALQLLVSPQLETATGTFYNHYGEQIWPSTWLTDPASEQLNIVDQHVEQVWEASQKLAARALSAAP
mmetsp:Transcript_50346/g.162959  ORF Transcript_50346/g.162959 Transcript_50346/m.162959 type:complete len:341 (+) Transcript_50346:119-1141(+)